MSRYRSLLYVQVVDASVSPDAVYRSVKHQLQDNRKDGSFSVYEYPLLNTGQSHRYLVIDFADPELMRNFKTPLNVNGEELKILSEPPNAGEARGAASKSGSLNLKSRQLLNQSVSYEIGLNKEEFVALQMLLSPASGIKLDYQASGKLYIDFPHSDLARVKQQLEDALNYVKELGGKQSGKQSNDVNVEGSMYCFGQELRIRRNEKIDQVNTSNGAKDTQECPICFDDVDATDLVKLKCGHVMHKECHTGFINSNFYKCPQCQKIISAPRGNQPENGSMSVDKRKSVLPGHEKDSDGTHVINYYFPNGTQTDKHPNPGAPYTGTQRQAFLPKSKEGDRVLNLLQKAFDARLTFTIGTSNTTGATDTVVWNNIHHKTGTGGAYGYPDATYLKRVTEELAAVGITDDD